MTGQQQAAEMESLTLCSEAAGGRGQRGCMDYAPATEQDDRQVAAEKALLAELGRSFLLPPGWVHGVSGRP